MDDHLFYTLRKAGPEDKPIYELTKWSEDRSAPLEVYVQWIVQSNRTFKVFSCNCPSRSNPCKHSPLSIALLESPLQLEEIYHDGIKVQLAEDI